MANKTPSINAQPSFSGVNSWSWTLGNADTGVGIQIPTFADKTVSITGTFGGATVAIIGSNDSTTGLDGNWVTLDDPQGNALSKTAAALKAILENPLWIACTSSGGSG